MAGLSDYLAQAVLNFMTGSSPMPALASRYLALFTVAPTADAGTGGTEVSGTGYARVQVAGALAAAAAFTTASTTITLSAAAPSWVVAGMNIYDTTAGANIGTVLSVSSTTVTLTAAASHASSGTTDSLVFSAWNAAAASRHRTEHHAGQRHQHQRHDHVCASDRDLGNRGCLGHL